MNYYLLYILVLILIIVIYIYPKNKPIEPFEDKKDTVFVINLDKRTDRWKTIQEKFRNYPFFLQRFSAIQHHRGWIGCGLSHMRIVQMAKDANMPYVLLIEDDCKPTQYMKFWPQIKEYLHSHKDNWDIFLGGNCYYNYISMFESASDSIKPLCKLNESIDLYYTKLMCTQFLYINSSAYDKYLQWEENQDGPVDAWPDKVGIRTISCVPFIAIQENDMSDIRGYEYDYKKTFARSEKRMKLNINTKSCF